jgi:4-hydroxy-3-polyprenylbenzoate decarboxylase
LFERVSDFQQPVVTNLFGSERRICLGLEAHSTDEVIARVGGLLRPPRGESLLDRWKSGERNNLTPQKVKTAPCQQVVRLGGDIDLSEFPAPRSHPHESRRLITSGALHWRASASRARCLDHCLIEIIDRSRLGVHVPPTALLAQHLADARERRQHVPLAVTLGGDVSQIIAGCSPKVPQLDAMLVAGTLRGAAVELVSCRSHDLEVPADVELVFEGHVDPQQCCASATFGNELGWYSEPSDVAVLELAAVTHRVHPVWPATILGQPPHELCAWRQFVGRLLLPVVQLLAPEVVDLALPDFGAAARFGFVAIEKRYPRQAAKVAQLLWGLDAGFGLKFLVVVDEHVNVHDPADVWRHVAAGVDPSRDLHLQTGPAAPRDHAGPEPTIGGRVLIDATRKLPGEHPRPWPAEALRSESVRELVNDRWDTYRLNDAP